MGLIAAVEQLTATVERQGAQIERLAERVSGLAQGAASLYGAVGAMVADVDNGVQLTANSRSVRAGREAMAEFERFNQPPGGQL